MSKLLFLIIYCFLFIILLAFIVLGISSNNKSVLISSSLSIFFLYIYIYEYFFVCKNIKSYINPESIFVSLFSLCHFSYVIFYFLGMAEYDKEVFWNPYGVNNAVIFSLMCVICYILSFRLTTLNLIESVPKNGVCDYKFYEEIRKVSTLLIVVCILFFWIPLFSLGLKAFSDYKILISVGMLSSIGKFYWLGQYISYVVIALYFYSSYKSNLNIKYSVGYYFIIFYILGYLFIGDRGTFISLLFLYIFGMNFFSEKIQYKRVLVSFVIIIIISTVLSVTRVESIYNPIDMLEVYLSSDKANNPIVDAFIEFGVSIKTVNIAMTLIPNDYDYWYGHSLIDSFLIALPNIFGTRVSSGNLGAWVTEVAFGTLSNTYGRGGSIAMEAYVNFGYFGVLLFSFLGWISGITYKKFINEPSLFNTIFTMMLISALSIWVRNTSSVSFRIVIWGLFISTCVAYFTNKMYKKT